MKKILSWVMLAGVLGFAGCATPQKDGQKAGA